jgi:ubiquinone/menaquinone biosynthesis C-methylase UbiE
MSDTKDVLGHYDVTREEFRMSEGLGQLELLRTREILKRHLPAPPSKVIDVGGGTGVHAAWLADGGYGVHLVDITPRHVELVRRNLGGHGVTAEIGDARALAEPDDAFDAALLLGPLYHLTERHDRIRALQEAERVVRPGGVVAAAAISRFASLFDGLAHGFLFTEAFKHIVERDLRAGQHRNPTDDPRWFTTAFFHHADELEKEAADAGLKVIDVVGVEGLAGWLPSLAAAWEDEGCRETILYSARATESERSLRGLSAHMLVVARV